MERRYGRSDRIWVMDCGMVSEENKEFLREGGRRYILGTPKSMLNRFEQEIRKEDWSNIRDELQVKTVPWPPHIGQQKLPLGWMNQKWCSEAARPAGGGGGDLARAGAAQMGDDFGAKNVDRWRHCQRRLHKYPDYECLTELDYRLDLPPQSSLKLFCQTRIHSNVFRDIPMCDVVEPEVRVDQGEWTHSALDELLEMVAESLREIEHLRGQVGRVCGSETGKEKRPHHREAARGSVGLQSGQRLLWAGLSP